MIGRRMRYMTRKYPLGMSIFLTLMFLTLFVTSFLGLVCVFALDMSSVRKLFCMTVYIFVVMVSAWGAYEGSCTIGEEIESKRRKKREYEAEKTGEDKR